MNPTTGDIAKFDSTTAALKAGFSVLLTPEEAEVLTALTKEQRIAWGQSAGKLDLAERLFVTAPKPASYLHVTPPAGKPEAPPRRFKIRKGRSR